MSNPFNPPDGPPPEKNSSGSNAPSGSMSNPFEAPEERASESQKGGGGFASPPGLPPNRPGGSSSTPAAPSGGPIVQPDTMDVSIPDEPPPAYSSAPAKTGEQSVQTGPARMDFSGPPPIPDRLQDQNQYQSYNQGEMEQHITGVGYGYRPEPGQPRLPAHYTGSSAGGGGGGGYAPPPHPPSGKSDTYSEKPMNNQPTGSSMAGGAGPSRQQQPPDLSPTEIATPGRPLLRKGQLLVYPKNHFCSKCQNTGYKKNDPNNPHDADWRKYGKPYNAALQASYKGSVGPYANASTQASTNFQRPLPDLSRPPQQQQPPYPPHAGPGPGPGPGPGMNGNGGSWNHHPGNYRPPPPPPHQQYQGWGAPPPQQWGPPPPQIMYRDPYMPGRIMPGGLVVNPGDPRIGGVPCWRCGGEGRELSFFGFDDGKCKECRGIGRIFPHGR